MNSIAIYLMAQLMKPFVASSLRTHFGPQIFDGPGGPLVKGISILAVFWLICLWLYAKRSSSRSDRQASFRSTLLGPAQRPDVCVIHGLFRDDVGRV